MNYLNGSNAPQLKTHNEDICSIVADRDGTIIGVNHKFSEVCGYDLTEVIGKPHSMFFDPKIENYETLIEDLLQKVSNGQSWEGYVKKLTKYGESIWVHLTVNPIGMNGEFLSICRIAFDEEVAVLTSNHTITI